MINGRSLAFQSRLVSLTFLICYKSIFIRFPAVTSLYQTVWLSFEETEKAKKKRLYESLYEMRLLILCKQGNRGLCYTFVVSDSSIIESDESKI